MKYIVFIAITAIMVIEYFYPIGDIVAYWIGFYPMNLTGIVLLIIWVYTGCKIINSKLD